MGEILQPIKRINRTDDKNVYQPKIHSKRIKVLYQIGKEFNVPITVLVDQAIESFINQLSEQDNE